MRVLAPRVECTTLQARPGLRYARTGLWHGNGYCMLRRHVPLRVRLTTTGVPLPSAWLGGEKGERVPLHIFMAEILAPAV